MSKVDGVSLFIGYNEIQLAVKLETQSSTSSVFLRRQKLQEHVAVGPGAISSQPTFYCNGMAVSDVSSDVIGGRVGFLRIDCEYRSSRLLLAIINIVRPPLPYSSGGARVECLVCS